jgi:hypothetical protein
MIDSDRADVLLREAIDWLEANYGSQVFYVERDIVYTLQNHLVSRVDAERLPFRVYDDYPIIPGQYRHLSVDLALVSPTTDVLVAAEFKYEPCHQRLDLLKPNLPVTIWADVVNDTLRAHQYVDEGRATVAYAVCIDEGNYIAKRDLSGVATVLEVSQLGHGAFVMKAPMMLSPVLTLRPPSCTFVIPT